MTTSAEESTPGLFGRICVWDRSVENKKLKIEGCVGDCRIDKARTAARAIRAEEYVLPNHSCLARQHTIKIRLLSLHVKPASADKKQGLDVQGPAQGVTPTRHSLRPTATPRQWFGL